MRLGVTLWCLGNEYSGYYCQIGASLTWAYYKPLQETWESWQTIQWQEIYNREARTDWTLSYYSSLGNFACLYSTPLPDMTIT